MIKEPGNIFEFIYLNGAVESIITPEGRAVKSGITFYYEYNLTDHLGNVRATYKDNGSGTALQLQESHYYPFGLAMQALTFNSASATSQNKYLFGGKELNTDFSWMNYDFGARNYDPAIARWHAPDPANQFVNLSPYAYCGNNPIIYVDPDGRKRYRMQEVDPKFYDEAKGEYSFNGPRAGSGGSGGSGGSSGGYWVAETTDWYSVGSVDGNVVSISPMGSSTSYSYKLNPYNPSGDTSGGSSSSGSYGFGENARGGGSGGGYRYKNNEPVTAGEDENQSITTIKLIKPIYKLGETYGPVNISQSSTLKEFVQNYNYRTLNEIINERSIASILSYNYPGGPKIIYVQDPLSGKYIDMKHFLIVGQAGWLHGTGCEIWQFINFSPSAFDPQDLWSNNLGYDFWKEYGDRVKNNPTGLVNYISRFLYHRRD